ncbi:MAG: hypothetical protein DRO11_00645 [Methanobacteriota archaeon]|nr:MAG: hypothetical protein DRO11_00645 [Euryarchaeota archaeon]
MVCDVLLLLAFDSSFFGCDSSVDLLYVLPRLVWMGKNYIHPVPFLVPGVVNICVWGVNPKN